MPDSRRAQAQKERELARFYRSSTGHARMPPDEDENIPCLEALGRKAWSVLVGGDRDGPRWIPTQGPSATLSGVSRWE
jgi:hypothetical protein